MSGSGTASSTIVENRRARHDYTISDTYEAGIELRGSEIKSIRAGNVLINEAYVRVVEDEVWLMNCHIAAYSHAGVLLQHDPRRDRKLLLRAAEIKRLTAKVSKERLTILPLKLYFKRHMVKVLIGVGKFKRQTDKRETIKRRESDRDAQRAMRRRGR